MTQRPESLKRAEELLRKFEWSKDYSQKFATFGDAMSILKDNLSNESLSAEDKEWIRNTKLAYTRIFLSRLTEIPQEKGEAFLFLLFAFAREEVEIILTDDPALTEKYRDLLGHFREELIYTLQGIDRRYNRMEIES